MITKEANTPNKFTRKEFFVPAARIGFKHLLKCLEFKKGEKILLPSYIGITDAEGSGVFDPVSETKTDYDFYLLDNKLAIDKADFENQLKTGKFKAVLIIHYFGFLQNDIEWLISQCKQYGVFLIEDCAHTLNSSHNGKLLGEFGDFSFFSIHKIIATDDGGILKINNDSIAFSDPDSTKGSIKPETVEQLYRTDFHQIISIRRQNYEYLLEHLNQIEEIELFYPNLNKDIVPLNFPILVKNGKREKLYFNLEKKGVITCSLYYRLIEQIDKNRYPISYEISNSILNLPVHQDITLAGLDFLVEKLKIAIKEI